MSKQLSPGRLWEGELGITARREFRSSGGIFHFQLKESEGAVKLGALIYVRLIQPDTAKREGYKVNLKENGTCSPHHMLFSVMWETLDHMTQKNLEACLEPDHIFEEQKKSSPSFRNNFRSCFV